MKRSEMDELRLFVSSLKNHWLQQINAADVALELEDLLDTFNVDDHPIANSSEEDRCLQAITELVGKLND